MYRCIFSHFYVMGPKASEFGEITQSTRPLQRRARSFKVIDFDTNWKLICDSYYWLIVTYPILHRFQVMADSAYVKFSLSTWECLSLTPSLVATPANVWISFTSSKTRRIVLPDAENHTIVFFIHLDTISRREWRTDRLWLLQRVKRTRCKNDESVFISTGACPMHEALLLVCLSICPMPSRNSKTENHRKFKFGPLRGRGSLRQVWSSCCSDVKSSWWQRCMV